MIGQSTTGLLIVIFLLAVLACGLSLVWAAPPNASLDGFSVVRLNLASGEQLWRSPIVLREPVLNSEGAELTVSGQGPDGNWQTLVLSKANGRVVGSAPPRYGEDCCYVKILSNGCVSPEAMSLSDKNWMVPALGGKAVDVSRLAVVACSCELVIMQQDVKGGLFYAIESKRRKLRWSLDLRANSEPPRFSWAWPVPGGFIVLVGRDLFRVSTGGQISGHVRLYKRSNEGGDAQLGPDAELFQVGDVLLLRCEDWLYRVRASDGAVEWSFNSGNAARATPVWDGGGLYLRAR